MIQREGVHHCERNIIDNATREMNTKSINTLRMWENPNLISIDLFLPSVSMTYVMTSPEDSANPNQRPLFHGDWGALHGSNTILAPKNEI